MTDLSVSEMKKNKNNKHNIYRYARGDRMILKSFFFCFVCIFVQFI